MVLSFNSVIFPEPAYVEQKEAPDDDIHGAHEITIRPEIQPEIEARTTYLMHFFAISYWYLFLMYKEMGSIMSFAILLHDLDFFSKYLELFELEF